MDNLSKYFIIFFESIAIFMAMFFIIQYSILKKKEQLWFTFYILLIACYYPLAIPDLFFNASLNDQELIARFNLFKRPVQFGVSVFYSLFVTHYLRLKERSRPLYLIYMYMLWFYLLLAIASFAANYFGVDYDSIYYIISLLLFPVQLYVLMALFKYKVDYSNFIIWASIVLLMGSIVTLLFSLYHSRNPGGAVTNANSYLPVMVSILTNIFLLAVAIQKKIADNEKSLINVAYSRQQAVMLERERIIADLHDDVGGGLSSIRMMSDLMAHELSLTGNDQSIKFAGKISDTAKDVAHRMNTIVWSLNTENDTLHNFVEYVRHYGINFFENSPTKFKCNISENLPLKAELSGVQRKNLFLIIKESLNNILKHSGASIANVNIQLDDDMLCIQVSDNGSGIKEQNEFGNGLNNMHKRMAEINGGLEIKSINGTHIILSVLMSLQ